MSRASTWRVSMRSFSLGREAAVMHLSSTQDARLPRSGSRFTGRTPRRSQDRLLTGLCVIGEQSMTLMLPVKQAPLPFEREASNFRLSRT